ncbi:hypothetical protein [Veillonella sp. CHU594]|uniref:virion core protein, T7 gp14 family n=1 Tax=Veillonella sp. CHU594 TaxID=2490948 RepID=UPI0013E03F7B|nr:hypothetical protein [Veillonella sp. CHU594]DAV14491.1 MAG TPA: hypothetical protein [Bacteriophage sp.]
MCMHPLAMLGIQAISGMMGAKAETKAQVAMYENQAKLAEYNTKMSERKAEQIADNAGREQKKLTEKMRLALGQNRNEAGASSLMSTGSVKDVMDSSHDSYVADSLQLLQNQRNDVDSQALQTWNYKNQAANAYAGIQSAKQAGRMKMLGTLLSTAASVQSYLSDYGKIESPTSTSYVSPTRTFSPGASGNANPYGFTSADSMFSNFTTPKGIISNKAVGMGAVKPNYLEHISSVKNWWR